MLRHYLVRSLHRRPNLRRTYTDAHPHQLPVTSHQSLPFPVSTFDFQLLKAHAMKFIRYGKYVGEPADAIDLEELVKRMGDFFLQSGFKSQFYGVSQMDPERSMEALREAILRALQEGDLLPEDAVSEELRKMLQDPDAQNNQAVKDLLDKLMERLAQEGFINPQQPPQVTPPPQTSARGQLGHPHEKQPEARFEITDKTIDFLGFKTLQDLLGSLGRSSFGRHDTRDLSTG